MSTTADRAGQAQPGRSASGPTPAAFHYGPAHRIMYGNPAFVAAYGAGAIGQPAREAMTDLPASAFALMDRVLREGRPLAGTLGLERGDRRLVVVPRQDPDTGETYGVTTYLQVQRPA